MTRPSPSFRPPTLHLDAPPPGDPLDEHAIAAQRHAHDLDEEGLAGLVPVDRILALAGGIVGGIATTVVALALEFHVRRVRRANARDD